MSTYETEDKVIIHKSGWAITQKQGNQIYKIFLHDAYPKIKKEVSLLQLSLATNASLSFDNAGNCWVCKSDYIGQHRRTRKRKGPAGRFHPAGHIYAIPSALQPH